MSVDKSNIGIVYEKLRKPIPLRTENICEAYDAYWFTSFHFNALYRIDKSNFSAKYICSFPDELSKERMYSKIIATNNKLFCIPLSAGSIGIYDVITNECYSIKIEAPKLAGKVIYDEKNKFFDAFSEDQYIILFPHTFPALIRLDITNYKIEYFYEAIREVENPTIATSYYFSRFVKNDLGLIVWSNVSKIIYKFDHLNMNFSKVVDFGILGDGILGGINNITCVYSKDDNSIYIYNSRKKTVEKVDVNLKEFVSGTVPLTRTAAYGDFIYYSPGTANYPIKIDIKTSRVLLAKEIQSHILESPGREVWKFGLMEVIGDKLFLFDATSNQMVIYDNRTDNANHFYIFSDPADSLSVELQNSYWLSKGKQGMVVSDLKSFIQYIK